MKDEQTSATALLIAASLVLMHNNPRYPGAVSTVSADVSASVLKKYSRFSRLFLNILGRPWFHRIASIIEKATVPGVLRHYALRKKCIAQLARDDLQRGTAQIVILGAGFDSLAVELQREFPNARFWEIDHPLTQRHKRSAVRHLSGNRFHFVPSDLFREELNEGFLNQTGFRSVEKTLWIAEGLLMYFPERVVLRLLQQMDTLSAPGSSCAFTFMKRDANGRIRFQNQTRLVDWWLRVRGEPFQWGIPTVDLPQFVVPWGVERIYDERDLREFDSAPKDVALAAGELICLAQV